MELPRKDVKTGGAMFIARNVWPQLLTLIIRFKSKWPSIVFITRFNFDWRRRKLDISAVNYTFILCSCETLLNISHKRMVFSTMEPSINTLLLWALMSRKEVRECVFQYNDVEDVLHHCHDLYYVNVPDLLEPSGIRRIRNETLVNCWGSSLTSELSK